MRFADITGQEDLKRHLVQSVDAGRISHAQLFTGQAGAGALALAVAYVQYLCCCHRRGGIRAASVPTASRSLRWPIPTCIWSSRSTNRARSRAR